MYESLESHCSFHKISKEVFYTSKLAYGIVNLKPIVPGHVLVISKRVVPRFQDLTEEEVFDLWLSAQRIGTHLESFYQAQSMTYCIQDGKAAGQSVPHVHIHIIPRRFGDFERTDQVYELLEKKDSSAISSTAQKWRIEDAEDQRPSRTEEEMQREAQMLCELFASPNVT
eukprot:jgi/Galph1/5500/GphlegSOOS_G4125.1